MTCMPHSASRSRPDRRQRRARGGFSLVEAVLSVAVVGTMLAAVLNTVGASRRTQYVIAQRSRGGLLLANALMTEILRQCYEEPGGAPVFGIETGEAADSRAQWDDVDDYHGWSSSPPQDKEGGAIPDFEGWTRSVTVEWVTVEDPTQPSGTSTGLKRITVTVKCGELVMASLIAFRTSAWDTDSLKVLLVVTDANNPTGQESARKTLIQSWGHSVILIEASSLQSAFDTAVSQADVAYVSKEIDASELGTKLRNAPIGVVNEHAELIDEFGFAETCTVANKKKIKITDNSHYVTSAFSPGNLNVFSSKQDLTEIDEGQAPGFQELAQVAKEPALGVLEAGAELSGGGTAAGRRVLLPWGGPDVDINLLTDDGKTLMRRAIEWAAE